MGASTAKQAATSERRRKAISLRLAGLSWQSIADRLGYPSRGAACTDVSRALERHRREEAAAVDELRQVAVMQYDRLQAAYWLDALAGDVKAALVVLRCIDARARVEGLHAPVRASVEAQLLGDEILGLLDSPNRA